MWKIFYNDHMPKLFLAMLGIYSLRVINHHFMLTFIYHLLNKPLFLNIYKKSKINYIKNSLKSFLFWKGFMDKYNTNYQLSQFKYLNYIGIFFNHVLIISFTIKPLKNNNNNNFSIYWMYQIKHFFSHNS